MKMMDEGIDAGMARKKRSGKASMPTEGGPASGSAAQRPTAHLDALVVSKDRLQVILPNGAARMIDLEGHAEAACRVIRENQDSAQVPGLAQALRNIGSSFFADQKMHPFLATVPNRLLAPRAGVVHLVGGSAQLQSVSACLDEMSVQYSLRNELPDRAIMDRDLVVIRFDDRLGPSMEDANQWANDCRVPLLPFGVIEPRRIQVGPLVVPDETACLQCFAMRRLSNSHNALALQNFFEGGAKALPEVPESLVSGVGAMAAQEAARFMIGSAPPTLGAAFTLGIDHLDSSLDPIPRVPRCPTCSRLRRIPPVDPWIQQSKEGSASRHPS